MRGDLIGSPCSQSTHASFWGAEQGQGVAVTTSAYNLTPLIPLTPLDPAPWTKSTMNRMRVNESVGRSYGGVSSPPNESLLDFAG